MENTSPNNKVVILNGFSHEEIAHIMKAVKGLFEKPRDLIFAKTTKNSLEMKLRDLIEDISEDHAYLMANPPARYAQSVKTEEARMKKVNLNLPSNSAPDPATSATTPADPASTPDPASSDLSASDPADPSPSPSKDESTASDL